mgnify:FL=1
MTGIASHGVVQQPKRATMRKHAPQTARKRQGIASSTEKPQIPLRGRIESSAKSIVQTLENEKVVTNPRYAHSNVRWQELTGETAFRFATTNIDLWTNSYEITLDPAVGPRMNAHNADSLPLFEVLQFQPAQTRRKQLIRSGGQANPCEVDSAYPP